MRSSFSLLLSPERANLYLDELFLTFGGQLSRRNDGSGHIDPGGPELALRYFPLPSGDFCFIFNTRFFEPAPKLNEVTHEAS